MDFDGLSLKHVKALNSGGTKRLLAFIQDAMPLRLKEVHFVKQPFIFNMVWALIKPFLREKLKNRVRNCEDNCFMENFHELFLDVLPWR